MTRFFLIFGLILASVPAARAQAPASPSPSIEIVKSDIDLEAAPDGQFWQVQEDRYRALDALGVQALQQRTLNYTAGYQLLTVRAYTLKKDGTRIDVPQSTILQGHGETSTPGFNDTRTMTVVFPNLEVGDQVVLTVNTVQTVPWFKNVFADIEQYSRSIVIRDVHIAFTTRENDSAYHIVATDLDTEPPVTVGGKTRHVWRFHNDTPVQPEAGATTEVDKYPSLQITSLGSYADVGRIYSEIFRDRSEVTPEISKLAESLTVGVRDRRTQAKLLYDWVASHIQYVNIVLGAGGFVPHKAADVLKNGYGDCKDHVMILQALLAARGIKSSAVLIRAGASQYRLPAAASPFLFDHLISYLPEFQLFVDSTARYAPFGVLPGSDAGKEVVIVTGGKTATTPPMTAANNSIIVEADVTLNKDGSADGDTKVVSTGGDAVIMRDWMASLPPEGDTNYFRTLLGQGSDGKFQRGNPQDLASSYAFSAHYHQALVTSFSGPGALPPAFGFRPFSFSQAIGVGLPDKRARDYVCASGVYKLGVTATLPEGVSVTSVPPDRKFSSDGIELSIDYKELKPGTVREDTYLKLDRPGPVCRAADYARIRPQLAAMMAGLLGQILYR